MKEEKISDEKNLNKEEIEKKIEKEKNDLMIFKIIVYTLIGFIIFIILNKFIISETEVVNSKPIIYLYPTEETQVEVKLVNNGKITCSYPKYKESWNVKAKPNGDLEDLDTGKNLYSLYYESEVVKDYKVEAEGFIVKGEDVAEFLEEKLEILGLNSKEKEEFIVYWLPKLEANKYNYIRFASTAEIENNMPLEIIPKPDTTIRVLMTFKGLEAPIQVKEQKLEQVQRNGFVAVEWGGTEIK